MRFLLSNDDGVQAPGLAALAEALQQIGEVTVVAPDSERSAFSSALTRSAMVAADSALPLCSSSKSSSRLRSVL